MAQNINITKISFSNNNKEIFNIANITDSLNYVDDDNTNNNNNGGTNSNDRAEYLNQLENYESNQRSKKEQKQNHFCFGGKSLNVNINNTKNEDNNINNINNKNNTNNGDNKNNSNNQNNNNIQTNNINNNNQNDNNFSIEEYPQEFLANVVIEKRCRIFTSENYVVFENKYGENSCYLNVLLHFLYNCKDIQSYLSYLYIESQSKKVEEKKKEYDAKNKDNNVCEIDEEEKNSKKQLLILLGKILYNYEKALKNKNNRVSQLNNAKFREKLNVISNGKFPLNYVADPVDLLNDLFEIKNFNLKLHEEHKCTCGKDSKKTINYGNDSFIYQIYIEEVINNLKDLKLNIYINKLFKRAQMTYLSDRINCSKCQKEMNKIIGCDNVPNYLIINFVWNVERPDIIKVIKLYHLLAIQDNLNNLFQVSNKNANLKYYLTHIILYSSSLSHYITAIYNHKEKVFCLYDDYSVFEFKTLIELIEGITVNLLRSNEKYYYYPVLLFYSNNDDIYDENSIKKNTLTEETFNNLKKKCYKRV